MIDFLKYKIVEESVGQNFSSLSDLYNSGVDSPEALFKYMNKNFRNWEFTTGQSPETTLKRMGGSSHDQAAFVYEYMVRYLGMKLVDPIFFIELDPNIHWNLVHGETHSFCVFQTSKRSRFYWFENSAPQWKGIRAFKDISAIKRFILDEHSKGTWGNIRKFPDVEFGLLSGAYGDTLEELIDCSLEGEL